MSLLQGAEAVLLELCGFEICRSVFCREQVGHEQWSDLEVSLMLIEST